MRPFVYYERMTKSPASAALSPSNRRLGLRPGMATGIGSLPHVDPAGAVAFSFEHVPQLPFAPQMPYSHRDATMVRQWLVDVDGIVDVEGGLLRAAHLPDLTKHPVQIDPVRHRGLLAFLRHLESLDQPPPLAKTQITGPLTLGFGLMQGGTEPRVAFASAVAIARAWVRQIIALFERYAPGVRPLIMLDEPSLVAWADADGPIPYEAAVDALSAALAVAEADTGVHVCSGGNRRIAFEAGAGVVNFEATDDVVEDSVYIRRHLESGGWIAWGAVPTTRPLGERPEPLWRSLVSLWCDLVARGCEPRSLREQALITPVCGLAGHGVTQARRVLRLANEVGLMVHAQAVGTRLTIGA